MPHSLGLLALGCLRSSEPMEAGEVGTGLVKEVEEGVTGPVEEVEGGSVRTGSGSLGLGHGKSLHSSGQNSLILL